VRGAGANPEAPGRRPAGVHVAARPLRHWRAQANKLGQAGASGRAAERTDMNARRRARSYLLRSPGHARAGRSSSIDRSLQSAARLSFQRARWSIGCQDPARSAVALPFRFYQIDRERWVAKWQRTDAWNAWEWPDWPDKTARFIPLKKPLASSILTQLLWLSSTTIFGYFSSYNLVFLNIRFTRHQLIEISLFINRRCGSCDQHRTYDLVLYVVTFSGPQQKLWRTRYVLPGPQSW